MRPFSSFHCSQKDTVDTTKHTPQLIHLISLFPSGDLPASATVARKLLAGSWLCATWSECVAFARRKFEKYFNHKARQLLAHFPEGECSAKGHK